MTQFIVHSMHPDLVAQWSIVIAAESPADALAKAAALARTHHSPGTLCDLVADIYKAEDVKQWAATPLSDFGGGLFINGKVTGVGDNVPAVLSRFRGL